MVCGGTVIEDEKLDLEVHFVLSHHKTSTQMPLQLKTSVQTEYQPS